jgi:hypothetical protein
VQIVITPSQTLDIKDAAVLLTDIIGDQTAFADGAYDADWLRHHDGKRRALGQPEVTAVTPSDFRTGCIVSEISSSGSSTSSNTTAALPPVATSSVHRSSP